MITLRKTVSLSHPDKARVATGAIGFRIEKKPDAENRHRAYKVGALNAFCTNEARKRSSEMQDALEEQGLQSVFC